MSIPNVDFHHRLLGRSRNLLALIVKAREQLGLSGGVVDKLAGTTEVMLLCLVVLLIPTTLIGIGFPLASELTIRHLSVLGRRLGSLYALNTLVGTLGALTVGFLLLPYLGTQASLILIIAISLALFAATVWSQPSLRADRRLWRYGAEGTAVFFFGLWLLGPNYLADAQTSFVGGEVLAFEEARDATFVVMGYDSPEAGKYQQLLVNGWSYANNAPPGRRYMATLGHLPTLLHAAPRSAMVACVGTGTTVGALTVHPSLQTIRAVDLARSVFTFAPFFEPLNHRFYVQSKVESVVADARHYLLTTQESFDVITFEPPPPHDAGVVNLYSQEFYRLAKRRLEPGGVVAQWVPLDMPRQALPRMIVRTLMAEFPHVSLWIPNRMEGVAIASREPLRIDLDSWRERMAVPAVRADLEAIGFRSPEDIAATFVAADAALADLIGDVPVVTDDHPRLEYHNFYPVDPMAYEEITTRLEPVERYFLAPPSDPAALRVAREVITSIWREHEASAADRRDEAQLVLQQALVHDPENRYLHYLRAAQGQRWQ